MPDLSDLKTHNDPFEHMTIAGLFGAAELDYCVKGFNELSILLNTQYFEVAFTSLNRPSCAFRESLLDLFSGKNFRSFIEEATGFRDLKFCRVVCRSEPPGVSYPVHEDARVKKVSMIVYVGDHAYESDGTRLHGDQIKVVPFVPGDALVIPNKPGSPHSYGPFKQSVRRTILVNYSDTPELWIHSDPRYSLSG